MMRKAFSLAIALILAVFLMAGVLQVGSASADGGDGDPVPLDVAMQVAVNQLNGLSLDKMVPRGFSAAGEPEGLPFDASNVSGVFTVTKEGTNVYYAINLDPEGWVIVSADYVAYPIIAYSENGSYSAEDHPPAFDAWMANVENEIYDAITNDLTPLAKAIEAWKTLGAPTADFGTESSGPPVTPQSSSSVPKLMSTTWSQGGKSSFNWAWAETYDYYCPWEKNWWGFYRVSPTGCVATALGQIMRYHQCKLRRIHRQLRDEELPVVRDAKQGDVLGVGHR
jgi:hypothetical protein